MKEKPLISIIIPCFQEARNIEACLRSILAQEPVPGGFELLVVDGRSTDGTRKIIQRICREDERVRLLDNPQRFQSFALNRGILAAQGSIIIRMDAHTLYAPDYVKQCVRILEETQADNVGGPHRATGDSYIQRAVAAVHHSAFGVGGALSHRVDYQGYVDTVIYGCWRKETLLKIGLFDESFVRNQDDELNLRITRAGGKIYQSPQIKSWYQTRSSLWEVFRQYRQYGYWKVAVIRKHYFPASWRHLAPGGFLLALIVDLLLNPFFKGAIIPFWVMLGLYLAVTLVVSVATAWKTQGSLLPILPLTFAFFHFGYGVGFLHGLVDFALVKRRPSLKFTSVTR